MMFMKNWPQVAPPSKMAAGIKKQLATLCWKPMATKAMMGNQMPRILPAPSLAEAANQTAMPTSQLQPMPETRLGQNDMAILPWAMVMRVVRKAPVWVKPVKWPRKNATQTAPTKFIRLISNKLSRNERSLILRS